MLTVKYTDVRNFKMNQNKKWIDGEMENYNKTYSIC